MTPMPAWFKSRNIWFKCPSCGHKLVVDRTAAGYRADCPHCFRNIPIPLASTTTPTWFRQAALYASHVLLLAGGIGAGIWYASSRHEDMPPSVEQAADETAASQPAVVAETAIAQPKASAADEVNQQLLNEHLDLQGKYDKMVRWMIENYRGKYPLPENLVERLRIPPVNEALEVNPELTQLLRLSPEEKSKVQDVFNYIRTHITDAELERATIGEMTKDRITLNIPPYADVGEGYREDLYLTLEETLGGARFDRLIDVTGTELEQSFNYFGKAARNLTFEVIYPRAGEKFSPYLLIRDGWVIPDGDSVRLTKVTETAVTSIPDSYKAYQDHLPENVIRYSTP